MLRPLLLAVALCSSAALAQDESGDYGGYEGYEGFEGYLDPEQPPPRLRGVGRASLQTGWRLTTNETFYRVYYGRHPELERGPGSPGGPLLVGSFGYAFTEAVELSVDVVATGERLRLTGQPTLTTMTFAALVGARFQKLLAGVGRHGLVPFAGLHLGQAYVMSRFDGVDGNQEGIPFVLMLSTGATLRLSAHWGLTAEYRLAFTRGRPGFVRQADLGLESFSTYNAGGNWLSMGFTYTWAPKPSRGGGGFSKF